MSSSVLFLDGTDAVSGAQERISSAKENALLYSRNERIATVFQGISKFGRFTAKKAFKLFSFTARATCAVSDIVAQKTTVELPPLEDIVRILGNAIRLTSYETKMLVRSLTADPEEGKTNVADVSRNRKNRRHTSRLNELEEELHFLREELYRLRAEKNNTDNAGFVKKEAKLVKEIERRTSMLPPIPSNLRSPESDATPFAAPKATAAPPPPPPLPPTFQKVTKNEETRLASGPMTSGAPPPPPPPPPPPELKTAAKKPIPAPKKNGEEVQQKAKAAPAGDLFSDLNNFLANAKLRKVSKEDLEKKKKNAPANPLNGGSEAVGDMITNALKLKFKNARQSVGRRSMSRMSIGVGDEEWSDEDETPPKVLPTVPEDKENSSYQATNVAAESKTPVATPKNRRRVSILSPKAHETAKADIAAKNDAAVDTKAAIKADEAEAALSVEDLKSDEGVQEAQVVVKAKNYGTSDIPDRRKSAVTNNFANIRARIAAQLGN